MFNQAPGFMAMLEGPDHRIVLTNPAYLQLIDHRQVLGKTVAEALPDAAAQGYVDLLNQVYQSGEAFSSTGAKYAVQASPEAPINERFVDFVYQPVTDAHGAVSGIFVQGFDVTERRRAEVLRNVQSRVLELAVQNTPLEEALEEIVTTVEGLSSSGMLGSILLLDEDGLHLRHGAGPGLPAAYNEAIDGIEIGPNVGSCGTAVYRNEPVYVSDIAVDPLWVDFRDLALSHGLRACWSTPIRSGQGGILGTFAMYYREPREPSPADLELVDFVVRSAALVIERKRTETDLRESEERLRLVQAAGGVGSFDYDLQKDVAICSPEYYALFGLPLGYPINRETWPAAIHPDDRHKALEALDRAIAERQPFNYEYRIIRADTGEVRWLAGRAAIIFDAADRPWRYVGGNIDITDRRRAENELRDLADSLERQVEDRAAELLRAQEALRQSQKMEAVGQLTGGVAHDFNNLLQIVTGNLDILRRHLPADAARLRRAANNAMTGATRAASLTQRLLAFSRRQPLEPKPISVNRLVTDMSDLLGRTLGETIEIDTILSGSLWQVEADPNQLEASILNLAVNARDAMPEGGKLTIETANTHLDHAYAVNNVEVTPGQYVVICVSDSGSGMDEETIARAFEPFFTTKEVGRGTGLGLSMVYGFVKQSGGHVKIYSEPGEGTTVKIYLPRLITESKEEEPASEQIAPEGSQAETILVVEDDDDVRTYSVEVLRELGYRVLEAHDGVSAIRLLERQDSGVNLLFSDVVLPGGMTGAVVAEKARSIAPGIKVLFTTGYARNAIVHHGRLDPGVHLLTKPFTYDELAARVRDILDEKS
jgi:PAS domain S-box-containing protein